MLISVSGMATATVENDIKNAETNDSSAFNMSANNDTNEKREPPGFEAVFAIAGLLAVAYLVLRQREG